MESAPKRVFRCTPPPTSGAWTPRGADSIMCVYLFRDVDPVNLGSFARAYISMFRVTGDGRARTRASAGCLRWCKRTANQRWWLPLRLATPCSASRVMGGLGFCCVRAAGPRMRAVGLLRSGVPRRATRVRRCERAHSSAPLWPGAHRRARWQHDLSLPASLPPTVSCKNARARARTAGDSFFTAYFYHPNGSVSAVRAHPPP